MSRFKLVAGALAFLSVVGGAGLLTGAALAPVQVSAACENDECENRNTCKVNTTRVATCWRPVAARPWLARNTEG